MQAMLFAAGLGTRLQPLTNHKPKALVEINGKTLLQRSLENMKAQGISEVVINVHHFSDLLIDFLIRHKYFGMNIHISDESDGLLDTGGGVLKAKPLFKPGDPILIVNVDVLTNLSFQEVLRFHQQEKALATLVVRRRDTSRYLLFNAKQQLTGWQNTETGANKISRPEDFSQSTPYAFSGIHIIEAELLEMIEEQGKFSIIDLYLRLAKTEVVKGFVDEKSVWMDLGKFEQMPEAEQLTKSLDNDSTQDS
ncbi:nucleotidyltransferase family protein [Sunxiuqinia dokdonensis]|nr:nucleotidyltransferase family protein [Sunxiuqinia dokdonensis]